MSLDGYNRFPLGAIQLTVGARRGKTLALSAKLIDAAPLLRSTQPTNKCLNTIADAAKIKRFYSYSRYDATTISFYSTQLINISHHFG